MNDVIILWILGGFASVFLACMFAIGGRYSNLSERVTRLEAVMALFGEKAAKILHSPDDHLGIDELLDRYIDRNYELSMEEWEQLLRACERIEQDKGNSAGTRTLAAFLSALAHHKLFHPPLKRTRHESPPDNTQHQ